MVQLVEPVLHRTTPRFQTGATGEFPEGHSDVVRQYTRIGRDVVEWRSLFGLPQSYHCRQNHSLC